MRWLGYVCYAHDNRIPKNVIHEKLATATRPTEPHALCYKDANATLGQAE